MPSTYDPVLRLELQGVGDNPNTWGIKANNVFERIAEAIAGRLTVDVAGTGQYTLTVAQGNQDQSRFASLVFTGALTGNREVLLPAVSKWYLVRNNTTGNFTLSLRVGSNPALLIERGMQLLVYCDGTTVQLIHPANALYELTSFSSSSVTLGTGSRTFTVSPGKNFAAGQQVMAIVLGQPQRWMRGYVSSYTSSSGSLVVEVTQVEGTGSANSWLICPANTPLFYSGTSNPVASFGSNYDWFLNTANGTFFQKVNGSWQTVFQSASVAELISLSNQVNAVSAQVSVVAAQVSNINSQLPNYLLRNGSLPMIGRLNLATGTGGGFAFDGDIDTGLVQTAPDVVELRTGGAARLAAWNTGLQAHVPLTVPPATAPGHAVRLDQLPTPPSGVTLIQETTVSSSVSFVSFTLPDENHIYMVVGENIRPPSSLSSNDYSIYLISEVAFDTVPNWQTSNYAGSLGSGASNAVAVASRPADQPWRSPVYFFAIQFDTNPFSNDRKYIFGKGLSFQTSSGFTVQIIPTNIAIATPVSSSRIRAIRFRFSPGYNLTAGVFRLYRVTS